MKPSALLCAALLCLGVAAGAVAKEKKPAGASRGAGGVARGCDPGDLEACTAWAERQLAADPGDASFEAERKEAQGTLRTACAAGLLRACGKLADSLERLAGGSPDDALRVVTLRTRACAAGDARDCEKLGHDLVEKRSVASPAAGAAALQKACEARRPSACVALAALLESGEAGISDHAAGQKAREKACDLGDADACAAAADAVGRGLTTRDPKKLQAFDERACALGRGATCWDLSRAAVAAEGGKKPDPEKGLDYLRKACDGGDGNGCWELSRLTAAGAAGGPRDDDKAVELMLLACAQGKGGEACREATVANLRAFLPPSPALPPAPPRVHNYFPTLIAAGLTVLAGGLGVQQALASQGAASDLKQNPSSDSLVKRREVDDANRRSRLLYATAGALGAVTATFYFVF